MSGAIIPDDWDGSTYKCWKVQWPDSVDYSAILLGSISKPSYLDYWDADSGDAQEAANAIKSAYNATLPDFWASDCEDPLLTTKGFRVRATSTQAVPAATWTKVLFDEFVYNIKPSTWNLAENAQDMTIPASAGIWQYNASVAFDITTRVFCVLRLNNYYPISFSRDDSANNIQTGSAWKVDATWTWLNLWVYSLVANTILVTDDTFPWLTGHLVTSVEET